MQDDAEPPTSRPQASLYIKYLSLMLITKFLHAFGRYLILMGRTFSRPERMRMFFKQYVKEMAQLGVDSIDCSDVGTSLRPFPDS